MADLAITAANVVPAENAAIAHGFAGEVLTAGQAVYQDPATRKFLKSDNNSATAVVRGVRGIVLNSAAINQPISVQTSGDLTIGGTLTPGAAYFLSDTPGGLGLSADLATGETVTLVGLAKSASLLALCIFSTGVTI